MSNKDRNFTKLIYKGTPREKTAHSLLGDEADDLKLTDTVSKCPNCRIPPAIRYGEGLVWLACSNCGRRGNGATKFTRAELEWSLVDIYADRIRKWGSKL